MTRSFGIVDHKLAEADFFLECMATERNWLRAGFYFSAFASAARSVTFAIQASIGDVDGFSEWYTVKQASMRADPICRFFVEYRNVLLKQGEQPFFTTHKYVDDDGSVKYQHFSNRTPWSDGVMELEQQLAITFACMVAGKEENKQTADTVSLSRQYLTVLVALVRECYEQFGAIIDPRQYYELDNLARLGLTVEDVEEDLGLPRGWTSWGDPDEIRLSALKRHIPMPDVDWLFEKYLGTNAVTEE